MIETKMGSDSAEAAVSGITEEETATNNHHETSAAGENDENDGPSSLIASSSSSSSSPPFFWVQHQPDVIVLLVPEIHINKRQMTRQDQALVCRQKVVAPQLLPILC
jgi:hypothetical protein